MKTFHADALKLQVLADAQAVAKQAARVIAAEASAAVAARGRFVMALSGGRTPWEMLRALSNEPVPWKNVEVVQVDERVAPAGAPERNFTHLRESLIGRVPLPPQQLHAMPVEEAELEAAASKRFPVAPTDRRLAAGARPGSSGHWAGRPHGIARAGGSGP